MTRSIPTLRRLALAALIFALLFGSCLCPPDPDDIDVSPDCPDGRQAAATVQIAAALAGVRPVGESKQLRVRGNRDTEADLCFAMGADVSFLRTIEGTADVNETIGNLAHGVWEFRITALSGGDHAPIDLVQNLPGGSTQTLSIGSNAAGDLAASF